MISLTRSTTGMLMAALVKEQQLTTELERMRGIDVEHKETRTPMAMGEFDLVKEIIDKFGDAARVAKCQVDKLVDMAAPPPVGTGVENIREIIMMNKMTFDVSSDEWQIFLRKKIINNIERYATLIVFGIYVRMHVPKAMGQSQKAMEVYAKAMELDPNSDEAKNGYKDCAVKQYSQKGSNDPEEVRKRAMNDPEVQQIMGDPAMRMILEQMQSDPQAVQEHLQNPAIMQKIMKLKDAGLISMSYK